MANKALATRQKLQVRLEPSQRVGKARNPLALAARLRVGGPHDTGNTGTSAQRHGAKRTGRGQTGR